MVIAYVVYLYKTAGGVPTPLCCVYWHYEVDLRGGARSYYTYDVRM